MDDRAVALSECPIHAKTERSPGIRIRTLRCAHVGSQYVADRLSEAIGRFLVRIDTGSRAPREANRWQVVEMSELVSVQNQAEAGQVWEAMTENLRDGAPLGACYGGGGCCCGCRR